MKKAYIIHTASFPILMACRALMLLGLALSPLLKVKLLPDRSLPSLSVPYSYRGVNAVVVDSEVTSRVEALWFGKLAFEQGQLILVKDIEAPTKTIEQKKNEIREIITIKKYAETPKEIKMKGENYINEYSIGIKHQFW